MIDKEKEFKILLKQLIIDKPLSYFNILRSKNFPKYFEIYQYLLKKYKDKIKSDKISEYCYWFLNDVSEYKCCIVCGKLVTNFYGLKIGYLNVCSRACLNKSESHKQHVKEYFLKTNGCTNAAQTERAKNQSKKTCQEKYNADFYFASDIGKQKITDIWTKKYGVSNPNKCKKVRDKLEQTNLARYGKKCFFETDQMRELASCKWKLYFNEHKNEVIQHRKETCLEKFGVDNYAKTGNIHDRKIRKYKLFYNDNEFIDIRVNDENKEEINKLNKLYTTSFQFDSSHELKIFKLCRQYGLNIQYNPDIKFEYISNDSKHVYFPDFLIENKIVEVKGDHFFKKDENGNEIMYCPYRDKKWTDEEYKNVCNRYEAKHQCMKNNNVIILKSSAIDKINKIDDLLKMLEN